MKVHKLAELLDVRIVSMGDGQREIAGGMTCDVMSLSIARGSCGMAWVCAQANMNALAAAVMTDAACVIFVQQTDIDECLRERAAMEGMNVFATDKTAFEMVGRMYAAGIPPVTKNA